LQIAFFLLPKNEAAFLTENHTVRQAVEKMQYHGYSSVPLLDKKGHYRGTVTVADLFWFIKDKLDMSLQAAEDVLLSEMPRNHDNAAVSINNPVEDLIQISMEQNFIPVVDDLGVFIGLVPRRRILDYFSQYSV
jgi:CBS domain-containing protein